MRGIRCGNSSWRTCFIRFYNDAIFLFAAKQEKGNSIVLYQSENIISMKELMHLILWLGGIVFVLSVALYSKFKRIQK